MSSDKVTAVHLARRAIIYVRQSTPEQVATNIQSQRGNSGWWTALSNLDGRWTT